MNDFDILLVIGGPGEAPEVSEALIHRLSVRISELASVVARAAGYPATVDLLFIAAPIAGSLQFPFRLKLKGETAIAGASLVVSVLALVLDHVSPSEDRRIPPKPPVQQAQIDDLCYKVLNQQKSNELITDLIKMATESDYGEVSLVIGDCSFQLHDQQRPGWMSIGDRSRQTVTLALVDPAIVRFLEHGPDIEFQGRKYPTARAQILPKASESSVYDVIVLWGSEEPLPKVGHTERLRVKAEQVSRANLKVAEVPEGYGSAQAVVIITGVQVQTFR